MSTSRVKQPSEFVVVGLLAAFAGLLLWDTLTGPADVAQRGPIGPRTMPLLVAALLLVCAVLLAVDLFRGGLGTPDDGPIRGRSDWRTAGIVAGAILLTAATVEFAGWVLAGGVMFYLCLYAFGSPHRIRDLAVSAGMAIGSFYLFYSGLGIALPAGLLQGVL